MSKVTVTADAAGNVIIPSKNNLEWGYIRLIQIRTIAGEDGFARKRPASALILGTLDVLQGFGYTKDQELPGKIIFKEQLTPFSKKEPERDYKIAGDTKIVCCIDGQPIYRKSFYTENMALQDVLLQHTNGDDIKLAYGQEIQLESEEESIDGNKIIIRSEEEIDGNKL
jgi:hypothetical protein